MASFFLSDFSESLPLSRFRDFERLSVLYQPEPLKTTVGTWIMRFAVLPQRSQGCAAGEPNGSRFS